MKNRYFFSKEVCSENLLVYPCKDPNDVPLAKRVVAIYDDGEIVDDIWFSELGAKVYRNPNDEECKKAKIAILAPFHVDGKEETNYYQVLDYYIQKLQYLIKMMKNKHNFKHIIVLLPSHSDECSSKYHRMAYYAIFGLIKGLGKIYASKALFVNGIILNPVESQRNLKERIQYLSCDNSCNTVGQIFKL